MTLSNYRDISSSGSNSRNGFQFEFSCARCSTTWRSPFKPYRRGQLADLIYRVAFYLGDRGSMSRASSGVAGMGADKARAGALAEALELAEERFATCPGCHRQVCETCWNGSLNQCEDCVRGGKDGDRADPRSDRDVSSGGAPVALRCANCGAEHTGGRFCAECGFDMAATHKACPNCGVTCSRAARFCTDCGHGF